MAKFEDKNKMTDKTQEQDRVTEMFIDDYSNAWVAGLGDALVGCRMKSGLEDFDSEEDFLRDRLNTLPPIETFHERYAGGFTTEEFERSNSKKRIIQVNSLTERANNLLTDTTLEMQKKLEQLTELYTEFENLMKTDE